MRNKKILNSHFSLLVLALLIATAPALSQRKADLSRLVVIGDSLSAGYQNGSLLETQQVNGYASLIAAQKGVSLALPRIASPGIPNVLTLVDPGPPPVVEPALGTSSGRVNPAVQPMNLAVPGQFLRDALETRPDFSFDDMTDVVLGLPGVFGGFSKSQVEWAEALAPTTVLAWIGNMDALYAAIFVADPAAVTPVDRFEADYKAMMDRLAATRATLVVANIPDVTVVPFLTPAEDVAELVGAPLDVVGPALGIMAGDYVLLDALPRIEAILTGTSAGPLPASVVLTAAEAAAIRGTVNQYNAIIASEAAAHGAALVDINSLTRRLQLHGYVGGGQRLTTEFLGGLFSLDGVHPTNTGYALFANEFIRELNNHFAAAIPPVNVDAVRAADPLVLPGFGQPATALRSVSMEAVASFRSSLTRR